MDINLTGKLWGMPIVFNGDVGTSAWWLDPAWWQVLATLVAGLLATWVAWKGLTSVKQSVNETKSSIDKVETAVRLTAKLTVKYSARSIQTRYDNRDYKDTLDVIHDSLITRLERIAELEKAERKILEPLVKAAVDIVNEIDEEEQNTRK